MALGMLKSKPLLQEKSCYARRTRCSRTALRLPRGVCRSVSQAYEAPSMAPASSEYTALSMYSTLVPDTRLMGGSLTKMKAATVSNAVLYGILKSEQLGLKPYQQAIATALNYDGCRGKKGEERANCQLNKALVNVGALMAQEVEGRVCTEVDPRLAKDTDQMVAKVEALLRLYQEVDVSGDRLIFRLPGTWEGIQAAKALEGKGVATQVFLVYSLIQGVAAAQAGASVLQPNVGRVRDWYNKHPGVIRNPHGPREDSGFQSDVDPGLQLAQDLYNYCQKFYPKTKVMTSGIRSKRDALALAGCDYLIIPPSVEEALRQGMTMQGYNDGLHAGVLGGDEGEDQLERVLSPASAAASDMPPYSSVTSAMFHEQLGLAGEELLNVGLKGLVLDVESVLPYMSEMTLAIE